MCWEVNCNTCQKTAWGGCGAHIREIFARIPVDRRCLCGYSEDELRSYRDPKKPSKFLKSAHNVLYPKQQQGGNAGCAVIM